MSTIIPLPNDQPDDAFNQMLREHGMAFRDTPEIRRLREYQDAIQRVRQEAGMVAGIPADRNIQNLANLQTGITEEVRQQYASLTEERLREEIGGYFTQRLNPSANFEREETDEEYMRRMDAQEDAEDALRMQDELRMIEQDLSQNNSDDEEIDLTDEDDPTSIENLERARPQEAEVEQHYNGVLDQIERQGHVYQPLTTELVDQYMNELRQDGQPYSDNVMAASMAIMADREVRQYPLTPDQVISKPDFPVTRPVPVKYSRFKDAEWFGGKEDVLVGGAGGIGSWLSLLLTRAGFQVTVYDYDKIEEHNLSGQLFSTKQIGQEKTFALSNIINDLCGSPINNITEKYDQNSMVNPYMFSCFDNMEARKIMFDKWSQNFGGSANAIFIDGRLLFEQLTIFCIKGQDAIAMDTYKNVDLFSDADVATENCTLKQTTHTAAMIAAHMVGFFTNFLKSIKTDMDATNVPYRWEYFVPFGIVE